MCKPASFVVTKDQVFWSKNSDSHQSIADENNLHTDGVRGVNVVFTEVSPAGGNVTLPVNQWKYMVDERSLGLLPDWYDAADVEKRCRVALAEWAAQKLIWADHADITDGNYFICGGTVNQVSGGTVNAVWGGTVITYVTIDKGIMTGASAVIVDRSGDKPKCYVGIQKKAKR